MSIRLGNLSVLVLSFVFYSVSAVAADVALHLPGRAEARLDQAITLRGTLHSAGTFSGMVALSADMAELSKASPDISIVMTPATATLSAGVATDVSFKVTITTTASSHSFQALPVQVSAKASDGSAPLIQTVLLTVDPVYEINLTGGAAPEGWSSPMSLNMPKHDPAVTIRFVNLDTKSTHTIHGEGAIPHQDTDSPMAAATADHAGGIYEVTVPTGDPVSGQYRCHDHEEEAMLRTINFNN